MDLIMVLIVRSDLKMSAGKIAAQTGHAVQELVTRCSEMSLFSYMENRSPKVCLKVDSLAKLYALAEECQTRGFSYHLVLDAGLTQIPANTTTVLGIGPVGKADIKDLTDGLKLL